MKCSASFPSRLAFEFANSVVPAGGTKAGDGDGSMEGFTSGVLVATGGVGSTLGRCLASNIGLTTMKNPTAAAPPPSNRTRSMPSMIHGNFDLGFAAGGRAVACAGAIMLGVMLMIVASGSKAGGAACGVGCGGIGTTCCGSCFGAGDGTSTTVFAGVEKSA